MIKIEKKIVGYALAANIVPNLESLHEKVTRPESLVGSTYKVKTPLSEHALYITINDIVLNSGTDFEERRPYEIFINSRNVEHFQWVVALTRVISAVFRKGGDITFLVDELKGIFDPKGGYVKKGGYVPSLVAEIGIAIENHMKIIGFIKVDVEEMEMGAHGFPKKAIMCPKCNIKAAIIMDGCLTCLNCGDSKCG